MKDEGGHRKGHKGGINEDPHKWERRNQSGQGSLWKSIKEGENGGYTLYGIDYAEGHK